MKLKPRVARQYTLALKERDAAEAAAMMANQSVVLLAARLETLKQELTEAKAFANEIETRWKGQMKVIAGLQAKVKRLEAATNWRDTRALAANDREIA